MKKGFKKLIAMLTASCLLVAAVPFTGSAETETGLTYTFANDFVANADGIIQYTSEDYVAEDVAAVTLYWGDASGTPLTGWSAIDETDWATLSSGYEITGNRVIPWGAKTLVAEISFVDEAVEAVSASVAIPEEKQNSGEEEYTMFFISDSHVNADETNNTKADETSMVTRFTALKDLMNSLTEAGDNVIGAALLGDIAVGETTTGSLTGTNASHGYWIARQEDYDCTNRVLEASGIESEYPIWYINGNHDIIECSNGDNSAWIQFMDSKVALVNENIANSTYASNVLSAIQTIEKESQVYWYDTYVGENHFIYLSIPYNGFGIYSDEQLNWFEGLLAEDAKTGKTTFVIGHYPMSYTHFDAAGHFDNSDVFKAILDKYPNTVYISGHLHSNPEYHEKNIIVGDNSTTLVNTGGFMRSDTSASGDPAYKSNGIYCKVFEDRIEFYARVFYNFDDEDSSGYWVTQTSNVVNLKNTVNAELSAEIKTDSELLRNGTTATAYLNGAVVDTTAYNCKWYVGNTFVGTGATYTLSNVTADGMEVPSGSLSVKVTDATDETNYVWAISDTEAEVFIEISTAEELAKIGVDANYPLDGKYILMNDIDLSGYENWDPIGSMNQDKLDAGAFKGTLDGNGYAIKNMTVSVTDIDDSSTQVFAGLFYHTMGATIRNLVMYNANVTAGNSSYYVYAGAVVGNAEAEANGNPTVFSNVSVVASTVTVTAAKSSNKTSGGGAIAGAVNRKYGANRDAGATFVNCYSNSTITGQVNAANSGVGGLVGYVYNSKTAYQITNCIVDGSVTGGSSTRVGGLFGRVARSDTNIVNSYTNADKVTENGAEETVYIVSGTMLTTDFLTCVITEELGLYETWINSEQGPIPSVAKRWVVYSDYISISTAEELAKIGVDENYPLDGKYLLTKDIDLSVYENWDPIGSMNQDELVTGAFTGTLEGDGHVIKNMTVSVTDIADSSTQMFAGLFYHAMGATIQNLVIYNANVTAGNSSYYVYAGTVVGNAEADANGNPTVFSNISVVASTVTVTAAKSSNKTSGGGSIAGAVNRKYGANRNAGATFTNCYSNSTITGQVNAKNSGVGGLVGYVYNSKTAYQITNCIVDGSVTSGSSTRVGGLFGRVARSDTDVVNSYTNSDKVTENGAEETVYIISGEMVSTDELSAMTVSESQLGEQWLDSPQGPIPNIAESWILYADYIEISSAKELAKIGVEDSYPLDGKYLLTNDIDFAGYENWKPIGSMVHGSGNEFSGILEGNGHTIKNFKLSLLDGEADHLQMYGGIFAQTMGAEIRNIVIYNAQVTAASSVHRAFVGIIAGDAEADTDGNATVFSNISVVSSSVTVLTSSSSIGGGGTFAGSVSQVYTTRRVGGAKFINCYSEADITVNLNNGQGTAGGFVGYVYATKSPCEITDSIFDGTITGHDGKLTRIGGFVGKASLDDTVVTNAFSNSDKYTEKAADATNSIYPVSGTMYTTEELAAKTVSDLELNEVYWYDTPISAKLKLGLKVSDVDGEGTINTEDFFYIRDNLLAIPFNYDSQVIDSNRDDELDICDLVFNNNIIKIHE